MGGSVRSRAQVPPLLSGRKLIAAPHFIPGLSVGHASVIRYGLDIRFCPGSTRAPPPGPAPVYGPPLAGAAAAPAGAGAGVCCACTNTPIATIATTPSVSANLDSALRIIGFLLSGEAGGAAGSPVYYRAL